MKKKLFFLGICLMLCLSMLLIPVVPVAQATPAGSAPEFTCRYLSASVTAKIKGVSWRQGCPVALADLRLVQVGYWDFAGISRQGELIVHYSVAREVRDIFRELYQQRFPIARVALIDEYAGDDARSMDANNTSAFNFRKMTGSSGKLSRHAYGVAIDINPVQNPYVRGNTVQPSAGADYLQREAARPGMILAGDPVYQAFTRRGWTWGGDWTSLKDYQHFEKPIP